MKTKAGRRLFYLLQILLPLLAGAWLYLRFRPDTYLAQLVCRMLPSSFPSPVMPSGQAGVFLRCFAADILWAYALAFAVGFVLGPGRKGLGYGLASCLCLELLVEILQKVRLFHGTFDPLDLLLEAVSTCLAMLIIKKYEEAQHEKSEQNP